MSAIKQPRVFIQGPGAFAYMRMFLENGYRGAASILDADLVCFTGGADVDPELYGEDLLPGTHIDARRDANDVACFQECKLMGMYTVGICRGAQFLNVMCGGTLWQDVKGHTCGSHDMEDGETGMTINVTSTHHQQMIMGDGGQLLGWANFSPEKTRQGKYWLRNEKTKDSDCAIDAEVVWYEKNEALCFQPHPEFGNAKDCTRYFFNLLEATGGFQAQHKD